jgi:hypothetical protein
MPSPMRRILLLRLVRVSKNEQHSDEMERLGFNAIAEIDPIIVSDKEGLYKAILKRKPKAVVEVLEVIDE